MFHTFLNNEVGEVKPGVTTDKIGSDGSASPRPPSSPGFPGAGHFKIVSYDTADWYTASYARRFGDANITAPVLNTTIQGGPEGFI
jgi:hypothetical protein